MKIESKEEARKRGVPSLDRADALMLALCKPPQKIEFYSVRDLPRMGSAATGQRYHPEDYPSPSSRRWQEWVGGFNRRDWHKYF
jgi:hypothetical protein